MKNKNKITKVEKIYNWQRATILMSREIKADVRIEVNKEVM